MQRLAVIKYGYALVTTGEGFSNLARLSGTSLTQLPVMCQPWVVGTFCVAYPLS